MDKKYIYICKILNRSIPWHILQTWLLIKAVALYTFQSADLHQSEKFTHLHGQTLGVSPENLVWYCSISLENLCAFVGNGKTKLSTVSS